MGETSWFIRYRSSGKAIPDADGTWTYSEVEHVWAPVTVSLPKWENIPNDPALKKAWQDAVDALSQHEEGHAEIAADDAGIAEVLEP
jgi:predicted secreted Zn-dependent protease